MVQKIVTFNVALKSTERQWVQKIPEVYTNDLNSVSIQFNITDCNDLELTGSSAIVLLKMRDGSFFQGPSVDVSRTLNVFSYTLKENEGNHDGLAEIQLIVTIAGKEFGTQKYQFKVVAGLDSEVAREIMIYDWTSLTAEARAYIDQFTADELVRDAEFDNAQFDRNAAFGVANTARTEAFDLAQSQRVTDFNAAEAARVAAFNIAHDLAGTDHTTALNDSSLAATDRTNAATDRTDAATDRTLAGTDHTRAESDHTRADVDSATVGGYNARLTDVEVDTSFDATNLVTNGDMSNGIIGWGKSPDATITAFGNVLTLTGDGTSNTPYANTTVIVPVGNIQYINAKLRVTNADATTLLVQQDAADVVKVTTPINGIWYSLSGLRRKTSGNNALVVRHFYPSTALAAGKSMEVKNVISLDLTTIFGAGKEPTAAEMDRILARFTNSWFDGTKNLFAAKTAIEKQIALDSGAVMDGANGVINGDFNSTASWNKPDVTMTVANNVGTVLATAQMGQIYQTVSGGDNNLFYIAASIKVQTAGAIKLLFSTLQLKIFNTIGQYERHSSITKASLSRNLVVTDTRSSAWNSFDIKYVVGIDLTATFGAGNEPTVEQMDAIMAKFENSWFDGTKNLFQAKASLNKLMALDARTEFEMSNKTINGDFATKALAPWGGFSGTVAYTNSGKAIFSPDGTTMFVQPNQETALLAKNGNKVYTRTYLKSSANATQETVMLNAGITQTPVSNLPAAINLAGGFVSGITTLAGQVEGRLLKVYVSNNFASTAIAATSQFEFGYVTLIDLTAAFGAGKEPTLAEMDRLMARFPNSWFDGVKPIQTIETLYQEKANKTQEAWITPTLLNGWVNHDGAQPLQYRKDEFGMVHFRGKVIGVNASTAICTLPVGYRPVYGGERICSKYNTVTAAIGNVRVSIESAGTVTMYTTTTANERFDLGQLSFPTN